MFCCDPTLERQNAMHGIEGISSPRQKIQAGSGVTRFQSGLRKTRLARTSNGSRSFSPVLPGLETQAGWDAHLAGVETSLWNQFVSGNGQRLVEKTTAIFAVKTVVCESIG